jgi:hypothetical protein
LVVIIKFVFGFGRLLVNLIGKPRRDCCNLWQGPVVFQVEDSEVCKEMMGIFGNLPFME